MNYQALLTEVNAIARQAGAAILEIYGREAKLDVTTKENDSPLTEADLAAHRTIVDALQELTPALPILSEESKAISWEQRQSWQTYWLVDPLDGTKEFINRNGEFTVNIALIDNGRPVLGVVYVPVLDIGYTGSPEGPGKRRAVSGKQYRLLLSRRTSIRSPLSPAAVTRVRIWKHGSRERQRDFRKWNF